MTNSASISFAEYVVLDWAEDDSGVPCWEFAARYQRASTPEPEYEDAVAEARMAVLSLLQRDFIAVVTNPKVKGERRMLAPEEGLDAIL